VQNIVRKIITRQSEHNIVAVHSIDATKQRFVERVICAQSKIDPFLLGRATRSERETLDKAAIALLNGNLFISDDTNASIQDIRRACSLQKRSQGLSLIVIDRLNSLGVGYGGERIALSQNIRGLKAMATDLDVPVVVTCTIDPSRVEDKTLCPRLNHLPGVVQLFSDVVAILHRPDYWFSMTDADYDRFQEQKGLEVVEFTVAHQKGGQPDVARLVFFTRWARFDNVRWTPEDITSPRQ
jgi:replicative DNA helicase